jgi:hypothetical protein
VRPKQEKKIQFKDKYIEGSEGLSIIGKGPNGNTSIVTRK